jgi:hypothetical protein
MFYVIDFGTNISIKTLLLLNLYHLQYIARMQKLQTQGYILCKCFALYPEITYKSNDDCSKRNTYYQEQLLFRRISRLNKQFNLFLLKLINL